MPWSLRRSENASHHPAALLRNGEGLALTLPGAKFPLRPLVPRSYPGDRIHLNHQSLPAAHLSLISHLSSVWILTGQT